MSGGYLTVGHLRGAPVRVHWAAPVGAFVTCGMRFAPAGWAAFILLVLFHEIGHALVAQRMGLTVTSIDANVLGGKCWVRGDLSQLARSKLAWGGVLAQAIVLIATACAIGILPETPPSMIREVLHVWIGVNIGLIVLNLIPIRPLDGAEAWKLIPLLLAQSSSRSRRAVKRNDRLDDARRRHAAAIERELARLRELDDVDDSNRLN